MSVLVAPAGGDGAEVEREEGAAGGDEAGGGADQRREGAQQDGRLKVLHAERLFRFGRLDRRALFALLALLALGLQPDRPLTHTHTHTHCYQLERWSPLRLFVFSIAIDGNRPCGQTHVVDASHEVHAVVHAVLDVAVDVGGGGDQYDRHEVQQQQRFVHRGGKADVGVPCPGVAAPLFKGTPRPPTPRPSAVVSSAISSSVSVSLHSIGFTFL